MNGGPNAMVDGMGGGDVSDQRDSFLEVVGEAPPSSVKIGKNLNAEGKQMVEFVFDI